MRGQVFKRRWKEIDKESRKWTGKWIEANTWSIRFYDKAQGRHVWVGHFKTKGEARRELNAICPQVQDRSFVQVKDITFSELCDKWLETKAWCKPSTLAGYKGIVTRYLKPYFGERKLSTIRQEDVKAFVAYMFSEQKVGARTIKHALIPLSAMFRHGIANHYMKRNPCVGIDRLEVPRPEMRFLTRQQLRKLLAQIQKSYPKHYPFFLLLATTGMRRSEAFGLRWQDVDFSEGRINIRQSAWRGQIAEPKTSKARRCIPINQELLRELLELKIRQPLEVRRHDLVFPDSEGNAIRNDNAVRRAFLSALKKAELPAMGLHALRHSLASALVSQGVSVKIVQEVLGHSSAATTLDLYCHISEEQKREAISALNF